MDMLQTDLKGKQPHYELFKKTIEKAEVDNMQYNYMLHGTYSKTSTTSRPPSTASAPAPKAFMPPHQAEDVPICPQRALDMMQAMSAEEQQVLAQRMSNMTTNAEQTGDN